MQVNNVVRRFSKTPLKHRMSKYLLDYMLEDDDLLSRITFVSQRESLSNSMMVTQAGAEGSSFELEMGAVERDEVSLINGRLIKQTRKNRALWIHDPVQAVEVLRKFKGILHVEFKFIGNIPQWYQEAVNVPIDEKNQIGFSDLVREQIDLLISGILLKQEIDQALQQGDRQQFRKKVQQYKQVCSNCLWDI